MGRILQGADILLAHLKDDPLFRITIPSKTQTYMAAGKPILMAVGGDSAELVLKAGAGLTCEPGDAHGIATAVQQLIAVGPKRLAEMGHCGKKFYEQEMSVAVGVARFEQIFQDVATVVS